MSSPKDSRATSITLVLALVLCVYLLPTFLGILMGFGLGDSTNVSGAPTLHWFRRIAQNERLIAGLGRSLMVALLVATTTTLLLFAGLRSYSVYSNKGQKVLFGILLIPLFVPETTHALTLSRLIVWVGIPMGTAAVTLGLIAYVIPFVGIFVLLQSSSIPKSVFLASYDLGLTVRQQSTRLLIPILWPTLVSGFIFAFFLALNEYTRTMYLEANEHFSVFVAGQIASGGNRSIYAIATLVCGLGVIAFCLLTITSVRRAELWRTQQ